MENFNDRLLIIFEKYSLNASLFADKIGVQRSSLSHILSGRNKPSLDFILKICEAFPEIDLTWLTLGKGNFVEINNTNPTPFAQDSITTNEVEHIDELNKKEDLLEILEQEKLKPNLIYDQNEFDTESKKISNSFPKNLIDKSEIERVIIFYKDGSFKNYHPK